MFDQVMILQGVIRHLSLVYWSLKMDITNIVPLLKCINIYIYISSAACTRAIVTFYLWSRSMFPWMKFWISNNLMNCVHEHFPGIINYAVQVGSNLWVCGWNQVWPFKFKLLSRPSFAIVCFSVLCWIDVDLGQSWESVKDRFPFNDLRGETYSAW